MSGNADDEYVFIDKTIVISFNVVIIKEPLQGPLHKRRITKASLQKPRYKSFIARASLPKPHHERLYLRYVP